MVPGVNLSTLKPIERIIFHLLGSRDNSQIVYISNVENSTELTLYLMSANGEDVEIIPNVPENPHHPRWMPLSK